MDSDISLMLEAQKDNLQAFEELYHRYQRPIANFFFRLGCDLETTEDYVQEVFLRLWKARYNYHPQAKFTTFLFQIAKNYWINENDKKQRRPPTYRIDHSGSYKTTNCSLYSLEITDNDKCPPEKMLTNELEERIQDAIHSLKEKHRLVFVLSEIQGLKYKEIAEILGIPIGTVKSRMAIAEKMLREKLKHYLAP